MIGSLYEALKDGGTKEHLARQAAEEVANYEQEIGELKGDIKLLKWMLGFNLTISATMLFLIIQIIMKI